MKAQANVYLQSIRIFPKRFMFCSALLYTFFHERNRNFKPYALRKKRHHVLRWPFPRYGS